MSGLVVVWLGDGLGDRTVADSIPEPRPHRRSSLKRAYCDQKAIRNPEICVEQNIRNINFTVSSRNRQELLR